MVYKLLFSLVFLSPFNQHYNLEQIECPTWVPGTDEIVPEQMILSPALRIHNKMRCYCQVVKVKERECLDNNIPRNICLQRTKEWVLDNLSLKNKNLPGGLVKLPTRNLIVNVE